MSGVYNTKQREAEKLPVAWKKTDIREAATIQKFFRDIALSQPVEVLEFLPGEGSSTKLFLENLPGVREYVGLEIGETNQKKSQAALKTYSSVKIGRIPDTCEFPIETASQDLVIASFALNFVRMDQLYMFFSEARRVTRADGHLVMAGVGLPKTFMEKVRAKFWTKTTHAQCLSLNHYLSPEDWDTKFYSDHNEKGLRVEAMVFTRRADT